MSEYQTEQYWQKVIVPGGRPYLFLAIAGGWLVSCDASITFVPDPDHDSKPLPVGFSVDMDLR